MLANVFWSRQGTILGDSTALSSATLLASTNEQRAHNAESSLHLNAQLMSAAQAKANDMAARDYWSHNTPEGSTPWSFVTKAGYNYQAAGENLAYGFNGSNTIISGWMNSPEHRANILNKNFSDIGFGVATSSNFQASGPQTIVVALYAQPVAVVTAASLDATNASLSSATITSPARAAAQPPAQQIARIQVLTGGYAPWSVAVATTIAVIASMWFFLRHGLLWRKALAYSEEFIVHHRLLDFIIVSIAVAGFVLSRSAGIIH